MPKYIFNTTPERSKLMSRIRSKNTKPELRLRKALYSIGLRYRINDKKLSGTPDIVLRKYKLAIFVDGEFWHGKDWEINKGKLKSNPDFWIAKIEKNIERDNEVNRTLTQLGYTVLRFWSKDVNRRLGICVMDVLRHIENDCFNLYQSPN